MNAHTQTEIQAGGH